MQEGLGCEVNTLAYVYLALVRSFLVASLAFHLFYICVLKFPFHRHQLPIYLLLSIVLAAAITTPSYLMDAFAYSELWGCWYATPEVSWSFYYGPLMIPCTAALIMAGVVRVVMVGHVRRLESGGRTTGEASRVLEMTDVYATEVGRPAVEGERLMSQESLASPQSVGSRRGVSFHSLVGLDDVEVNREDEAVHYMSGASRKSQGVGAEEVRSCLMKVGSRSTESVPNVPRIPSMYFVHGHPQEVGPVDVDVVLSIPASVRPRHHPDKQGEVRSGATFRTTAASRATMRELEKRFSNKFGAVDSDKLRAIAIPVTLYAIIPLFAEGLNGICEWVEYLPWCNSDILNFLMALTSSLPGVMTFAVLCMDPTFVQTLFPKRRDRSIVI
ncbi:hypothetical protein HK101_002817 [Irineochytrium annulatum]|nr:hypothetical protein HK101_002817 [Irineochytrium annulatum]